MENVPAYTSAQVVAAIRNARLELHHHGPYLPVVVQSDFYFVSKAKRILKRSFSNDEDVIYTASGWLEELKELLLWYNGICALEKCWTNCISVAACRRPPVEN